MQEVEAAIQARKSEVEKLIADMKSANLESLTISPPEENKVFLDGEQNTLHWLHSGPKTLTVTQAQGGLTTGEFISQSQNSA